MFSTGAVLSTYCYAVTIRAHLGLGPLFAFQDGVARTLGISIGLAVTLVGVAMIVIVALLRSWPAPGTLVLPFLTGGILAPLLRISPTMHGYVLRLFVIVVATWFMALGGALSIRCAFGASAYSQVMLCLRRLTSWPIVAAQIVLGSHCVGTGMDARWFDRNRDDYHWDLDRPELAFLDPMSGRGGPRGYQSRNRAPMDPVDTDTAFGGCRVGRKENPVSRVGSVVEP
jgi:uncharacterized membrane protein YczE